MRSMKALPVILALAVAACGSSGTPTKSDGGSDRTTNLGTGGGGHGGGTGGAGGGHATGGAGGGGGMAGHAGAGGSAGQGGAAGSAGQGGTGGAAGQGGAAGSAGQGGAPGPHDAGADTANCSTNPDPCICGRPDANPLSASECAQEKACRAAGGVWEPYIIFPADGGSYGPRCQTLDGGPFDAS